MKSKGLTQNHMAFALVVLGAIIIQVGILVYFVPEFELGTSPLADAPSLLWGYGSGLLASGLVVKTSKIRFLENPIN